MIALDIETAGLLPGETREDSARARVAFDATRRDDGTDDTDAADRHLALSWPLARVVAVALCDQTRECSLYDSSLLDMHKESRMHHERSLEVVPCDGEADLLRGVAARLTPPRTPLVTFNGSRFDLPVMVARMVAHGIKPSAVILQALRQKPWESGVHVDLMSLFGHGNPRGVGSLRAWAVGLLGIDPKADGDGAHVGELIARRDGLALASYNLGDVRVAAALYQRWTEVMA